MKYFLATILLILSSRASATTHCDSVDHGAGEIVTLQKKAIMLKDIETDDEFLFRNKKVKLLEFYVTGGPEQGLSLVSMTGEKFDVWCTDEESPTDD